MQPRITPFTLGDFMTNCFVVDEPGDETKSCWIVDCGQRPDELLEFIEREGLKPKAILLTHAHCDHIWGIDRALSRLGEMPIHLHESEREWCADPMLNLSAMMGISVTASGPSDLLKDGDTLTLAKTTWRIMHAPGHSPGCVCFIHDESMQAIVGDTLFAGSIGRIDFPTSDPAAMHDSLFNRIMHLPDDTTIHPGHGESTTIEHERRTNPYLQPEIWQREFGIPE